MEFLRLCLIGGGGMSLPKGVTTGEAAVVSILVTCHKESEWGDRNHTLRTLRVSICLFLF